MEKKYPACDSLNTDNITNRMEPAYSESYCRALKLCDVAPIALAMSYHQLHEYVRTQNVGCTLFLIRDVFELMIKIPVTIIFNGIHAVCENREDVRQIPSENSTIAKLYDYSMQMLSTGKWWECVRIASGMEDDTLTVFPAEGRRLYADTVCYLRELHKLLFFRIPGKPKASMVTWRNRTLGHSCLADDPAETYQEIPYILEMFQSAAEISIAYYQKVCLTDLNRQPLRGLSVNHTKPEVYIQYTDPTSGEAVYTQIHKFIAGRDNSLSCFDGYEKGKAYLLNYKNGERYRDYQLSQWLSKHQKMRIESAAALSDENILADNLETRDIARLEEQLMQREAVTGISFLGRWLMHAVGSCSGGMLLLTGERGLGKSTFCSSIDPLDCPDVTYNDDAYREDLEEFLTETAVRVWHFNSEYRSRKDIFVPGLQNALLTLSPEDNNRICGRLESQYSNLLSCSDDLFGLYFAESLNRTMEEYRSRTDYAKLLLILDGIDEIPDGEKLLSYLPDPSKLEKDIYVLLTSRTKPEVAGNAPLLQLLEEGHFRSTLCFTRETVTVDQNLAGAYAHDNAEYRDIIADYVRGILREHNTDTSSAHVERLAAAFEYRFSSLAAYRKLCRLSPMFYHKTGTDLFGVFMRQVETNAPEYYVRRLKRILNTLAWVGEPITLRELAFLSGERFISYRLLGMVNDMQAFLRVTRSAHGNCYELSHPQWEEAVKGLIPYGDILFRRNCNELIAEMEEFFTEDNIALLLERTYEGELWLLMHILDIYNRSWRDLKGNWFEEIRIGSFETLIKLFLQSQDILSRYFVFDNPERPLRLLERYRSAVQIFGLDLYGNNGSKEQKLLASNAIMVQIADIYDSFSVRDDKAVMCQILRYKGDMYHALAGSTDSKQDKNTYRKKSLEAYVKLQEYLSEEQSSEEYAMCLYKTGRAAQLLDQNEEGKIVFLRFIKIVESLSFISYDLKEYLCRAYIRIGQIIGGKISTAEAFSYYEKALKLSRHLVEESGGVSYLDTLIWSEGVVSTHYEQQENWSEAIIHRECALSAAEKNLQFQNTISAYGDVYQSLSKLSLYYEKVHRYQDSASFAENALEMEIQEVRFFHDELLEALQRVYNFLGEQQTASYYASRIKDDKNARKSQAMVYKEFLEFLKALGQSYIDRIPSGIIAFMEENADKEYNFTFSVQKPVGSQLSKDTLALFALIGMNYWPEAFKESTRAKYVQNEEQHRLQYWSQLLKAISRIDPPDVVVRQLIAEHDKLAFFEVYDILAHLPTTITAAIPIETLLWLKNEKKSAAYLHKPHEMEVSELSRNTLCLLKYVLSDLAADAQPGGETP